MRLEGVVNGGRCGSGYDSGGLWWGNEDIGEVKFNGSGV